MKIQNYQKRTPSDSKNVQSVGIKDDLVSFTVSMVKDIMDEGFKIGQILGQVFLARTAFGFIERI
jgi:hypothetical protein